MVKKIIILLLITGLYCIPAVQAQVMPRVSIAGYVTDAETEKAIPMAALVIKELGRWSITDDKGYFSITGISAGSYTMEISQLGYETKEFTVNLTSDITDGRWQLSEQSLKLQEVIVTATSGKGITTSSRIDKQALEHVQPSSIKDVLQLLPGQLTVNPSLNEVNRLTIRETRLSDATNALGVALVVDGANISNDANMQVLKSGDLTSTDPTNLNASTAGTGVDARQIATDNIESIEVIRGIASVQYGDMTSGAVVVKTKAGVTPWDVRFKTDPALKQIAVGKGFGLGANAGALNFNLDYSTSYKDPRTPAEAYDRINAAVGYSNNFNKKVTFNAKLSTVYAKAELKSDPDNFLDEIAIERNTGIRLNINGRWTIGKPWITNLEYLVAGGVTQQYSRDKRNRRPGRVSNSTALSSGENIGFFTTPNYFSDLRIDGKPMDLQAKLTANLYGKYGNVFNKVLLGVEFNTQGNNGKGKTFNPYNPPDPTTTSSTLRERSYKDIPFLSRFTAFVEDKLTLPIGATELEVQAGVRLNTILSNDKFSMSELTAVEPRFNMRYLILKHQNLIKELALRGGWGLNYKMPSMVYLYPEPAYLDRVSYSYNDIDANGYGLAVFTTKRIDKTNNPDLKLQRSENIELGLDFTVGKVSGSVVFFNEKLTNGYGFSSFYEPFYFTRYGYTIVNGQLNSMPFTSGQQPVYYVYDNNGVISRDVFVNGQPLPKVTDTTFVSYSKPHNSVSQRKWGIEYVLNLGTIKAINTSINVDGAYMNIRRENGALTSNWQSSWSMPGKTYYPFVGIYAGARSLGNGAIDERLNTNLRFITHIPKIRMVVTLGVQMVFIDRSRSISEYNGEILTYFIDENGIKHTGKEAYTNTEYAKCVDPVSIMDQNGVIMSLAEAQKKYPAVDFSQYFTYKSDNPNYYLREDFPVYGMLNLRLTKEIGNLATVSFYANNFLNILGQVQSNNGQFPQNKNTGLYFGAEVKLTF